MKNCIKEKQIEKIENIAETNNDNIIGLKKDITYIRQSVKSVKENHMPHLNRKFDNLEKNYQDLKDNYIVFKARTLVYLSFGIVIFNMIVQWVIKEIFN